MARLARIVVPGSPCHVTSAAIGARGTYARRKIEKYAPVTTI
jgi:hypothetical protein